MCPHLSIGEKREEKERVKIDCEGWKGEPKEGEKNLRIHNRERKRARESEKIIAMSIHSIYFHYTLKHIMKKKKEYDKEKSKPASECKVKRKQKTTAHLDYLYLI
uniref:(northern house mosquito) hypothetical protein n=1 Tax=Culex pipiens TaxID=7175 RepID=A0A8D8HDY0_CULPI